MKKTANDNLLDILVKIRTGNPLDKAVDNNKAYHHSSKRQKQAFNMLKNARLNKEQRTIVDRAISATADCGAAYGTVAYKLGLQDGIKLISEIKKLK